MTEFFYRSGPNEFGPLDASELKHLAASGRLGTGDEVRRGRSGKWIPAASVHGLFDIPKRRSEHAINEMDVIAEIPVATALAVPEAPEAERDTAADTAIATEKTATARATERAQSPAPSPTQTAHAQPSRWAVAIAVICYLTSLVAVGAGAWRLTTAANELQQILGAVFLLIAIVSLAAGCAISLLNATLTNLSLSGRIALPATGFRGKK
jgi:uncharacterized protein DUF4339